MDGDMLMMTRSNNCKAISRDAFSGEFPTGFANEFVNESANIVARQKGAVLLIALIVLIAMTLSALTLIKSVNTTNLIAGNLAFRESAVLSSERSTEIAFNDWIMAKSGLNDATLHDDHYGNSDNNAYLAVRAEPASGANWDTFWNTTLKNQARTLPADVAGNTVSYVIHRLCDTPGKALYPPPQGTLVERQLGRQPVCSFPPGINSNGSFGIPDQPGLPSASAQVYYRITTKVAGPRNTVVYTQTTIAY
jgi:Tfp pilus assembly protein PilX